MVPVHPVLTLEADEEGMMRRVIGEEVNEDDRIDASSIW